MVERAIWPILIGSGDLFEVPVGQVRAQSSTGLGPMIEAAVYHHAMDPGRELGVEAKTMGGLHDGHEHRLGDVTGVLLIPRKPAGNSMDELGVALVENSKRLAVALGEVVHERFVVEWCHRSLGASASPPCLTPRSSCRETPPGAVSSSCIARSRTGAPPCHEEGRAAGHVAGVSCRGCVDPACGAKSRSLHHLRPGQA